MEELLDQLIQKWACKQKSQVSLGKAQCGHHIIRRKQKFTRWNIENIMPLTKKEHYDIHTNGLDYRTPHQKEYYLEYSKLSLKDYLLKRGLTKDEFKEAKLKQLYVELNIPYSKDSINKIIDKNNNKKISQSKYKKKAQNKSQEIWRKRQKELYQKKKAYLKSLKKK